MNIILHINYATKIGENLFVNISGENFQMHHTGYNWWQVELEKFNKTSIEYYYFVQNENDDIIAREWGKTRSIKLSKTKNYEIFDLWEAIDERRAFYSSAFTQCVNKRNGKSATYKTAKQTLELNVSAPAIAPNLSLAIAGNQDALGNWTEPLKLSDEDFPLWTIKFDAKKLSFPFEYKFLLIDNESGKPVEWEKGENHIFYTEFHDDNETRIHALTTSLGSQNAWKGAGTAIPVFAIRTENSFGIGDFVDLKKMIDWIKCTGQIMLQTLPINDTCMYFDRRDSYPYRAISIYALHPIYLNLAELGKLPTKKQAEYDKLQKELNALSTVDYDKVIVAKWKYFKEIFAQEGKKCLASKEYKTFFDKNEFWLKQYAMFSVLRDKFNTPHFADWKGFSDFKKIKIKTFEKENAEALNFYYYLQFNADKQMREASAYARKNGIILKGDIPIGISRDSVEAWTEPQFFNMNSQAGAPPDDFSVTGQNWGFPTYNWDVMRADGYTWWIRRFKKMADYFDAYRIDHILGFFRIWEIPVSSVQGLLGHFNPALPYSAEELEQRGLPMDGDRYLEPYIRCHLLGKYFGKYDSYAYKTFFDQISDDVVELKQEFDSQIKVEKYFAKKTADEKNTTLKNGLFALINNVLFIEDPQKHGHFHPRISAQLDDSYAELEDWQKQAFNRIYDEFFYHRHEEFWKSQAMEKLPMLIRATDMLVCGEDLGMIPHCVPAVMNDLQILSLEVQRMPKDVGLDFGNPEHYPYRAVCTTSSHDTSTIRGWWEENAALTQKYFNQMLHRDGEAPKECSGEIVEQIMVQHLNSPAMLAVFPLQDWLGTDEKLRRKNVADERINVPANPNNYWHYRMHLSVEKLLKEKNFNAKIKILAKRN